jgi:hypothetical protein
MYEALVFQYWAVPPLPPGYIRGGPISRTQKADPMNSKPKQTSEKTMGKTGIRRLGRRGLRALVLALSLALVSGLTANAAPAAPPPPVNITIDPSAQGLPGLPVDASTLQDSVNQWMNYTGT